MNGTGINIKLGSGGFLSTMLGGGIALIITNGLIEMQSKNPSVNLYGAGLTLIALSVFLYLMIIAYKVLHSDKLDIK